jgi:hypothetical protein
MIYTIYNPQTGEIQHTVSGLDTDQVEANLTGRSYIVGNYNSTESYIVDGAAVSKPPRPESDIHYYKFDYANKTWQIDLDQSTLRSRQLRNSLLASVDRINPVWYATLTSEQQAQLAQYRLDLLAVPQQSNFPNQVNWPSKPAWL